MYFARDHSHIKSDYFYTKLCLPPYVPRLVRVQETLLLPSCLISESINRYKQIVQGQSKRFKKVFFRRFSSSAQRNLKIFLYFCIIKYSSVSYFYVPFNLYYQNFIHQSLSIFIIKIFFLIRISFISRKFLNAQ